MLVKKNRISDFFSRHQSLSAFFVIVCLAVYALGANPFASETVAPFDRLLEFPGWASVHSNRKAVHEERSDIVDAQLPNWLALKNQMRNGKSPLWYPYASGGEPVAFEICSPSFLLFAAVKDNALAYYLVGLAKLVISGFGCYLLLKIFVRWLPSLWGGIAFMLCGFNAAWFFWEQVSTAMWIPWLLWAAVMYLKTEDTKWLPAITITSLLMIFGGFPAVAAYGFYTLSLLILVWNIHGSFAGNRQGPFQDAENLKRLSKKTLLPFLAVAIAFLMAAIAIFTFVDNMSAMNLNYRSGLGTPFTVQDLLLFVFYEKPPQVERTAYIGLPVVLLSLAGIFSLVRINDNDRKRFILATVLLVVVTTLITYGLIPRRLIEILPVFKNNSWGRLIVVPLLCLAVLSSIGLDFLLSILPKAVSGLVKLSQANVRWILVMLTIGVTVLQFYSYKRLFNNFNAVVPSAWFYPVTPSIQYVKERLKPLQSVIADTSYWFSGTLGAYGISEWYGHSFRTDREKEVLGSLVDDPFPSATSAAVDSGYIHYDSPLMDRLVIKYLLVNKKNFREPKTVLTLPESPRGMAPPLPQNSWREQIFLPEDMKIGSIGCRFGMYGATHAPADVRLTLKGDNHTLFFVDVDSKKITEDQYVPFEFPKKMSLHKGVYSLEFSLINYTGSGSLTAWVKEVPANSGNYLEINGKRTSGSLDLRMETYIRKIDPNLIQKKWKMIEQEEDILILENRQVTNSAYFIKNLNSIDDPIDFSDLDIRQPSPDLIQVNYSGGDAGWIVLPMHRHSGWRAFINGQRVKYSKYLGMLPAIPVHGASQVIFKYQPKSFRRGAIVSSIGILAFALFTLSCLKKGKKLHDGVL